MIACTDRHPLPPNGKEQYSFHVQADLAVLAAPPYCTNSSIRWEPTSWKYKTPCIMRLVHCSL